MEYEHNESNLLKSRCGLERLFLKNGSIMVWGDITLELAYNVIAELKFLHKKNVKEITLCVASDGGDIDAACGIIDYMQILQRENIIIKTVVEGHAYSCGCYISGFGTVGNRYATENSVLMLHETYSYGAGPENLTKSQKELEAAKSQTNHLMDSFAKHIGYKSKKQIDKFIQEIKNDLWMDVNSAIKHKIVDVVL